MPPIPGQFLDGLFPAAVGDPGIHLGLSTFSTLAGDDTTDVLPVDASA